MPVLERETFIDAPIERVFPFFSDPKNLARITPASLGFEIVDAPQRALRAGDRIRYRIRVMRVPLTWVTHITAWEERVRFIDEQERGPYKLWRHEHKFERNSGGVLMRDRVEYELPFGFLGALFGGWWVRRNLRTIFDYRANVITELFGARATAPASA